MFFFSSRRRHTRWTGDWSSDVCSSDLVDFAGYTPTLVSYTSVFQPQDPITHPMVGVQACYRGGCPGTMFGANAPAQTRSEERRVGKECRCRWTPRSYAEK